MYQRAHARKGSVPSRAAAATRGAGRPAPLPEGGEDALGPARGILFAALGGILLWGVMFLAVWFLFLR
ncbi:MAG: hypothetical protein ACREFJ_13435 [Acetobacteraceae bacterium]